MKELCKEYCEMLKELGFNEECTYYYDENGELANCIHYKGGLYVSFKNSDELYVTAPTHQQVMEWLWKKHSIQIEVTRNKILGNPKFNGIVFDYSEGWAEEFRQAKVTWTAPLQSPITAFAEAIEKAIEYLRTEHLRTQHQKQNNMEAQKELTQKDFLELVDNDLPANFVSANCLNLHQSAVQKYKDEILELKTKLNIQVK